jgi:hypothetical protein
VCDQPDEIVALDPRDPLLAAADGSAQAELERRKQIAKHFGLGAKHDSDAQSDDAHSELFSFLRSAFPGLANAMAEATLAAVKLGQRLVVPCAVPPDRRTADHHGRMALEASDQADDVARHTQPRAKNSAALGPRPQAIGDRLTGKIDDGVDHAVIGNLIEVGNQPERRPQSRGLGGDRAPALQMPLARSLISVGNSSGV